MPDGLETVNALCLAGTSSFLLKMLCTHTRSDLDFATRVAMYMYYACQEPDPTHVEAETHMDMNYWGIPQWFALGVPREDLLEVPACPWGKDVFESPDPLDNDKQVWETHFIYLHIPTIKEEAITIAKWDQHSRNDLTKLLRHKRFRDSSFDGVTNVAGEMGWHLIRVAKNRSAAMDRQKTPWEQYQQARLNIPSGYEVTNGLTALLAINFMWLLGIDIPAEQCYCQPVPSDNNSREPLYVAWGVDSNNDRVHIGSPESDIVDVNGICLSRSLPK